MTPSLTLPTRHAWWVHTAVNALNVPSVGCVTTIFLASRITPPLTGTLLVATRGPPTSLLLAPDVGDPEPADDPPVVVVPPSPPPQADTSGNPAPATTARPSTCRRLAPERGSAGGRAAAPADRPAATSGGVWSTKVLRTEIARGFC